MDTLESAIKTIKLCDYFTLNEKILFKNPSNFSEPFARLDKGRLLIIKKCEGNWCKVKTSNYTGWIKNKNVWGSSK